MPDYAAPRSLDEALSVMARGGWRVLAGGTDFYPLQGDRPLADDVIDISALDSIRGISKEGGFWRIGGGTTWTDVIRSDLPPCFDALKLAAREVGSVQIQNAGTVAGNLCNASPAADGVPPLLALEAKVELASGASGARVLPLEEFILGPRKTALAPGELVTAVLVPEDAAGASHFIKLGSRAYLLISVAMVAAILARGDDGRVAKARIAVGSCSPVARRLGELERKLEGAEWNPDAVSAAVSANSLEALSPLDDIRGSAAYRLDAAAEITRRALRACVGSAA